MPLSPAMYPMFGNSGSGAFTGRKTQRQGIPVGLPSMNRPGDMYAGEGLRYGPQPQMGGPSVGTVPRRRARPNIDTLNAAAGIPIDQMNLPQGFAGKYPNVTAGLAATGYVNTPPPPAQGRVYADQLKAARGTPGQGLMNDMQAQQFAGLSPQGYMPNVTVGGAYGQQVGPKARFNAATNRYETGPAGGYQNPQAMAAAQFGGLRPGMGTSASGSVRPMWMEADRGPGMVGGMGWDAAAAAGVARNPAFSRSGNAVVGSPNPDFAPITAEQLAANKAAYQQRRSGVMDDRQAGVVANAQARADQRRLRQGNLTMDERMQLGIPGLAVAREVGGAQRAIAEGQNAANLEIARGQVGLGDRQIAANQAITQGQQQMQLGIATGNQEVMRQGQQAILEGQKALAASNEKVAGIQAAPEQAKADAMGEEVKARRAQVAMEQVRAIQNQAAAARAAGNPAEASRLEAQVQGMLAAAGIGLPADAPADAPQDQAGLPPQLGNELAGQYENDVRGFVDDLRQRGYSDQEINKQLNRRFGKGVMPGIAGAIALPPWMTWMGSNPLPGARTADDPYGMGYSAEYIDPATGEPYPGLIQRGLGAIGLPVR